MNFRECCGSQAVSGMAFEAEQVCVRTGECFAHAAIATHHIGPLANEARRLVACGSWFLSKVLRLVLDVVSKVEGSV
jgi:hypothetical protein